MSLSPRPERFTRIVAPGISFARRRVPATACADSIAGMMPSVRASSENASIASASVTGSYDARPVAARWACSGPTPG